ncbi:kinase-like domain-containing protein [Glomus cerebriforme]|uniref:Kinase-like domain-containing protein n=1 Tax=Glomus cerebriforme TaxID=658196 RepID=A0A397T2L4_9GLOM|nr:kinase-like domain-containing protein [Glomus cerebriforme]
MILNILQKEDLAKPCPKMEVALKSLNNSKNVRLEFINEITSHHKLTGDFIIRLYGITQDPDTKNYIMVLQYAKNGSLRNYLDKSYNKLNWKKKIGNLFDIAHGLAEIHKIGLIHRDLHIGNLLHNGYTHITDMGLCKPADYNSIENTKKSVYGVLPYIAPEILRGQNYTKAADIYSFGIIICLDANPLNRPSALEVKNILDRWYSEPSTEAIYTSRLLNFNNLPEPKNSDDYYNQYDNIISVEYSETQQIDISQLKINENDDDLQFFRIAGVLRTGNSPLTSQKNSKKEGHSN